MKLVIDIDKEVYNYTKDNYQFSDVQDMSFVISAIANGTPLEKVLKDIKADIDNLHKVGNADDARVYVPINDVLDAIDKYCGKENANESKN